MIQIKDIEDIKNIATYSYKLINSSKSLPDQVFTDAKGHFVFFCFDNIFSPEFIKELQVFLSRRDENNAYILQLNPFDQNGKPLDFSGFLCEIRDDDNPEDYATILSDDDVQNDGVGFEILAEEVLIFGVKNDWSIYCNREFSICIGNFSEIVLKADFIFALGRENVCLTAEKAVNEYIDPNSVDGSDKIRKVFEQKYRSCEGI